MKIIFMKYLAIFFLVLSTMPANAQFKAFEKRLEKLRKQYHIPSLSVGIVHNRQLTWYKGFGYADIENKIVPDTHTVYHIASVTKTFGSIILMQQVEAGKVSLDDPIKDYGINLGGRYGQDPRIKVKHLLTHTAQGAYWNWYNAGINFRYNGAWYGKLGNVIQKASGHSFGELVVQNIIKPLQLQHTAPSLDDTANFALTGYDRQTFAKQVAKPYNWQGHQLAPVKFKYGFGAAAGLMSSVSDLAVYSVAIDEGLFLEPETWKQTFSAYRSLLGKTLPYGLGWFTGYYDGIKVVWHTGWWWGYSALFIKVPSKDLTFIVLANSQDLSRPFYLTMYPVPLPWFGMNLSKDLMVSDFARTFWEFFVD
jgi:CubicO group peptidase (beta-lactamase class C family)